MQLTRDKLRSLEFDISQINSDLKSVRSQLQRELIEDCVEQLLERQKEGKLEQFTLRTYLDDLAMNIRNLYDN